MINLRHSWNFRSSKGEGRQADLAFVAPQIAAGLNPMVRDVHLPGANSNRPVAERISREWLKLKNFLVIQLVP